MLQERATPEDEGQAGVGEDGRDEMGKLSSKVLAALIVDALCDAGIVRKADRLRAIEVTAEEVDVRKALGDD
jgi:hypothetical protein